MDEYISRETTVKAFCEKCKGYYEGHCVHRGECDVDVIQTAPAADVQPVKHGRWINVDMLKESKHWKCSCCKGIIETGYYCYNCYYNYCPNCGAKMDIIYEDDKIRAIKVTGGDAK